MLLRHKNTYFLQIVKALYHLPFEKSMVYTNLPVTYVLIPADDLAYITALQGWL